MSFAAGSRVGPYEIVGLLGAGGMGEVFRARDERLGREVAVKILPASFSNDTGRVRRFEQEARAAGALNHPNILAVYDVGSHEGVAYLVSELLEGQTLRDRMAGARLPLRKAVDYTVQAAQGLAAAHDKGIVHRDLKPENLFVTLDGLLKILDFGLAKQTSPARSGESATEARETEPGTVLGTVGYMSPEQVLGRPADHRSDLFSLGAILFELLAGRRAFERASAVETMNAILKEEPPDLSPEAAVPPALERIVRRCLEKGTSERFQSARDLAFALESLSAEGASRSAAGEPTGRGRRLTRAASRLGAAALVALLLAVAGGFAARLWLLRNGVPVLDRYRFTPLATAAGYEGQPSWSPDGRSVAYVGDVDGVLQVHTRSLDSSKSARITQALSDCREPFWSPDGTRIYYTSLAGSSLGLWSVGATGGTPQVVVRNARVAAMAPDGQRLVLLREEGQQGAFSLSLWVSSPPAAEPVRYPDAALAARRFGAGFLRFSPDGKRLGMFVASTSGDRRGEQGYSSPELWLLPQPSGAPRQVLPALSVLPDAAPFGWMPDGRRIVLGAEFPSRTPGTHLWLADTESDRLSVVTASSGNEEFPAVSPDGRQIAFTAGEEDYDLVEIPLAGPALRTVLGTSRSEADPAWSPQGGRYAYVTDRTGRQEIWLRTPDGQFDDPLVTAASFPDAGTLLLSGLAFSPDGQRIAYQRRSLSGFRIWISTMAGGRAVRLSADEGYQDAPTWSPDGAWIAFTSLRQGRWALMRAPTGGGEAPTTIRAGIVYPSNPRWSPRGDWILCELSEGVALVSPDGQKTRVLADESWLGQAWSKDGSRVYAVRLSEALRLQLVEVDVASGRERTLVADLGPAPASDVPLRGLSLSPDGRSLLTSIYRLRGDLWLLEGF
jgi:Tol biopolymer transport system component